MNGINIGIMHPGEMGVTVGLAAQNSGGQVFWASEDRSSATRARAEKIHLQDTGSLAELCQVCSTLICVCPPSAAASVARQVASLGFRGSYIDANAVSPQHSRQIGDILEGAGISYIDGSIIGPPAWKARTTRIYLSGAGAASTASFFSAGPLTAIVMGDSVGQASALKMCYAAYTKGTSALLCAILAASEALQVRQELFSEWSHFGSNFVEQTTSRVQRVTAKAWRFEGEMHEIASTFDTVGLPAGFHLAAAQIYSRISGYKDLPLPELEQVLSSLLEEPPG